MTYNSAETFTVPSTEDVFYLLFEQKKKSI